MYTVLAAQLNFSTELREQFIYNEQTLLIFLPVDYEEGGSAWESLRRSSLVI